MGRMPRPNWPDLWRDYDSCWFSTLMQPLSPATKLTWFMKGLRLTSWTRVITLVHEGPNWPDLWRDYDAQSAVYTVPPCYGGPNWPDLWRDYDAISLTSYLMWVQWPNWPDLWRDYDLSYCTTYPFLLLWGPNWPDLWRDYDSNDLADFNRRI